jgi:CRP-like cAMP-binding protein
MLIKSFLKSVSSDVQDLFLREAIRKEYKRGDVIYKVGDAPKGIYFVEKGLVGITITGQASGKEHLLRFFKSGQFFGHRALFSQEGYHGTTTVLEPTTILLVPKETVFTALDKNPLLYKDILTVVAKELRRSEEQHVMILENQILSRIGLAIIYLKDLHPDHNWTRQEIANFCASTVSTVIKALSELEDRELIKQEGRAIQILDREALISLQDSE